MPQELTAQHPDSSEIVPSCRWLRSAMGKSNKNLRRYLGVTGARSAPCPCWCRAIGFNVVFKEHFHVIESKAVWAELLLWQSKIAPFAMGTAWGPEIILRRLFIARVPKVWSGCQIQYIVHLKMFSLIQERTNFVDPCRHWCFACCLSFLAKISMHLVCPICTLKLKLFNS